MSEIGSSVHHQYPTRSYKIGYELERCVNSETIVAEFSSLSTIDERVHASTKGSQVAEFLKGKSIFITGGTGFVGKLLVEKLLRSCKDINKIYLMVRAKGDNDPASRMENYFKDIVFSELHKVMPDFVKKIVIVEGDLTLPNLGISENHQNVLVHEVNIIIHAAATVHLLEKLKVCARINIKGTQEVLKLAERCKHLVSFVYVSSAYSNCHLKVIEEKFYDLPYTDDQLFRLIDELGEDLEQTEKSILGEWPNAYTFTKAIAEQTVRKHTKNLPACIVRPTIIVATYKEPIRSWTDNYYGPIGVLASTYRGVIRTFFANPKIIGDVVPGDYVVNGIIAAAYNNDFRRDGTTKIYNLASSVENPITYGDFQELSMFYGQQFPTLKSLWYPYVSTGCANFYVHLFLALFLHILPALLIDFHQLIFGKKLWAFSIYRKVFKFNKCLAFFTSNEWIIGNSNTRQLWQDLSATDKKIYNFSMAPENLNWNEYLSTLCGGLRIYMFKDDWATLPAALKKYKRLYCYHIGIQTIVFLVLIFMVLWILNIL